MTTPNTPADNCSICGGLRDEHTASGFHYFTASHPKSASPPEFPSCTCDPEDVGPIGHAHGCPYALEQAKRRASPEQEGERCADCLRPLASFISNGCAEPLFSCGKHRYWPLKNECDDKTIGRLRARNRLLESNLATLQAKLDALVAESARLSGELAETQTLLLAATNQLTEARTDLTWERGWALLRKSQMGAVVEAARAIDARYWKPKDEDIIRPLRVALAALDAPSQPEPASEPRAIVEGSTWKQGVPPGIHVKVQSVVGGVQYQWRGEKGYDDVSEAEFRLHFTHVSDPPASETAEGTK